MKYIKSLAGITLFILIATSGFAAEHPMEARTTEAVQAADDAWGAKEIEGDFQYVDWLLLDGYRSISSKGEIKTKEEIVEGTRKRGNSLEYAQKVKEWNKSHPSRSEVKIYGDTAILNWVSTDSMSSNPIYSSDIFVYREGHWHGVYSQHTAAE